MRRLATVAAQRTKFSQVFSASSVFSSEQSERARDKAFKVCFLAEPAESTERSKDLFHQTHQSVDRVTVHQRDAFRASVDAEPLVPTEVRRIRKKLGLSQREAGEIFGGGIRAFS
jgi:hypothetical protein